MKKNISEELTRKEFNKMLRGFVDFTVSRLDIKNPPQIRYKESGDQGEQPSFGGYAPGSKELLVHTKNRHPMDIFRTVAHELVHHKQNEDGRLGKNVAAEGSTGSDIENEANSEAGKIMRYFGKENPFYFDMSYVTEGKAIILGGTPGSGKDRVLKEAILPLGFREVSFDTFQENECDGKNLVINGTMSVYEQTENLKNILESNGYDTMMVFVNTSNRISKLRNEARSQRGGRVINEHTRYKKWQTAQMNLDKYDQLFEKVVEVVNDVDADTLQETYKDFMTAVSKEVELFVMTEADRKFETLINEVGGAGNWGTDKLRMQYQKDTPGQMPATHKPMKVLKLKKKVKEEAPIAVDRIGPTATSGKNPYFTGNIQYDGVTPDYGYASSEPISRWMMKEDTKKKFRERYGNLAEQKMKETAAKLSKACKESLTDPYSGGMSDVAVTGGPPEDVRPNPLSTDLEKKSFYKYQKNKRKLKNQ